MICRDTDLLSIAGRGESMIDPHYFANWVSDEAKAAFAASGADPVAPVELAEVRRHYDGFNRRMLETALELHPVEIAEQP
jgi:hypothetical protein